MHALLRDMFLTIYSKKKILYLSLLFSFSYHGSKYLHFALDNFDKEVIMLYNSKMMETDLIYKSMKLSKFLYTFTASVMFYCPTSARNIITDYNLYPLVKSLLTCSCNTSCFMKLSLPQDLLSHIRLSMVRFPDIVFIVAFPFLLFPFTII